jgi:Domain of unknown function (DUF4347)
VDDFDHLRDELSLGVGNAAVFSAFFLRSQREEIPDRRKLLQFKNIAANALPLSVPGYFRPLSPEILSRFPMIRSAVITSLVIIDSTVADYQSLIAGLVPGAEAIVLERDRDGVEQITEALANYSDLKSVHIVSLTLSHWDTT